MKLRTRRTVDEAAKVKALHLNLVAKLSVSEYREMAVRALDKIQNLAPPDDVAVLLGMPSARIPKPDDRVLAQVLKATAVEVQRPLSIAAFIERHFEEEMGELSGGLQISTDWLSASVLLGAGWRAVAVDLQWGNSSPRTPEGSWSELLAEKPEVRLPGATILWSKDWARPILGLDMAEVQAATGPRTVAKAWKYFGGLTADLHGSAPRLQKVHLVVLNEETFAEQTKGIRGAEGAWSSYDGAIFDFGRTEGGLGIIRCLTRQGLVKGGGVGLTEEVKKAFFKANPKLRRLHRKGVRILLTTSDNLKSEVKAGEFLKEGLGILGYVSTTERVKPVALDGQSAVNHFCAEDLARIVDAGCAAAAEQVSRVLRNAGQAPDEHLADLAEFAGRAKGAGINPALIPGLGSRAANRTGTSAIDPSRLRVPLKGVAFGAYITTHPALLLLGATKDKAAQAQLEDDLQKIIPRVAGWEFRKDRVYAQATLGTAVGVCRVLGLGQGNLDDKRLRSVAYRNPNNFLDGVEFSIKFEGKGFTPGVIFVPAHKGVKGTMHTYGNGEDRDDAWTWLVGKFAERLKVQNAAGRAEVEQLRKSGQLDGAIEWVKNPKAPWNNPRFRNGKLEYAPKFRELEISAPAMWGSSATEKFAEFQALQEQLAGLVGQAVNTQMVLTAQLKGWGTELTPEGRRLFLAFATLMVSDIVDAEATGNLSDEANRAIATMRAVQNWLRWELFELEAVKAKFGTRVVAWEGAWRVPRFLQNRQTMVPEYDRKGYAQDTELSKKISDSFRDFAEAWVQELDLHGRMLLGTELAARIVADNDKVIASRKLTVEFVDDEGEIRKAYAPKVIARSWAMLQDNINAWQAEREASGFNAGTAFADYRKSRISHWVRYEFPQLCQELLPAKVQAYLALHIAAGSVAPGRMAPLVFQTKNWKPELQTNDGLLWATQDEDWEAIGLRPMKDLLIQMWTKYGLQTLEPGWSIPTILKKEVTGADGEKERVDVPFPGSKPVISKTWEGHLFTGGEIRRDPYWVLVAEGAPLGGSALAERFRGFDREGGGDNLLCAAPPRNATLTVQQLEELKRKRYADVENGGKAVSYRDLIRGYTGRERMIPNGTLGIVSWALASGAKTGGVERGRTILYLRVLAEGHMGGVAPVATFDQVFKAKSEIPELEAEGPTGALPVTEEISPEDVAEAESFADRLQGDLFEDYEEREVSELMGSPLEEGDLFPEGYDSADEMDPEALQ